MYLEIFLADFAVFRGNTWISQVLDRAKCQKPCPIPLPCGQQSK